MRKSFLLTALFVSSSMLFTSCDEIKDLLGDGDGSDASEKVDLNYGLDAEFTFEGNFTNSVNNGVTVSSSNDLTFVEGTQKETQAIKFNREKKSQLNISKALIGGKDWTISFWGKDLYDGSIFHVETASGDQMMSLSATDGKLHFVASNYSNSYSSNFWDASDFTSTAVNDGQWHHILLTVTYDSIDRNRKINLYIDNQYQDQKTFSYDTDGVKLVFGGEMNFSVNTTNMSIDNLRIYSSRAINKKEIAALYNKDKTNYTAEVPSYVVPQSLYTYYTFENNLNDITENQVNGFFNGTPNYVPGVREVGSALQIDTASSKMIVPRVLDGTRKWSFCFWAKNITNGHILSMCNNNDVSISLVMIDNELKFVTGLYNHSFRYNDKATFNTPNLNDNQWHHIAITCDYTDTRAKLYVDGNEIDVISGMNDTNNNDKFILGGDISTPKFSAANFTIDNLRFYDTRLLSAEEIRTLYQAGE